MATFMGLALLLARLLGQQVLADPPNEPLSTPGSGASVKATLLSYLEPVLRSSGKMARIYYAGSCEARGYDYAVLFPPLGIDAPSQNDSGLMAIRKIFRNVPEASVTEDKGGMFRIVIGHVQRSILDTKIPGLAFDPIEQYSQDLAIWMIMDRKEISAAETSSKMQVATAGSTVRSTFAREPTDGFPHLPESLGNVTMDQALDAIATTFGGIVVYGTCAEQARYHIYFVPVRTDLRR